MDGGVTGLGKDSFAHGSHMDPRVEAAARALCEKHGVTWHEDRDLWREDARAALAAADAVDELRTTEYPRNVLAVAIARDRYREALERIAAFHHAPGKTYKAAWVESVRMAREVLGGGDDD